MPATTFAIHYREGRPADTFPADFARFAAASVDRRPRRRRSCGPGRRGSCVHRHAQAQVAVHRVDVRLDPLGEQVVVALLDVPDHGADLALEVVVYVVQARSLRARPAHHGRPARLARGRC